MLAIFSLISLHYCEEPPVIQAWSHQKDVLYLADRVDAEGVVAVIGGGKALLLDANGTKESVRKFNDGERVLRSYKEGGDREPTIAVSSTYEVREDSRGQAWPISFGQGMNTIYLSRGCSIQTKTSAFAIPKFGGFSAVAVRNDGLSIAYLNDQLGVPNLLEYSFNGVSWSQSMPGFAPRIPDVGLLTTSDRSNDLRFVSDHKVVLIGQITATSPISSEYIDKTLQVKYKDEIAIEPNQKGISYLTVIDLTSQICDLIVTLRTVRSPEGGGPYFGRMSVSVSGKYVYICRRGGIARVRIDGI
ncbi:hypothetical protein BH11ARM1_BH11ARM1_09620 [soil metagenome]